MMEKKKKKKQAGRRAREAVPRQVWRESVKKTKEKTKKNRLRGTLLPTDHKIQASNKPVRTTENQLKFYQATPNIIYQKLM